MREVHHGRRALLLVAISMLTVSNAFDGPVVAGRSAPPTGIPSCTAVPVDRARPPGDGPPPRRLMPAGPKAARWASTLDGSGSITGHTLTIGRSTWHAGPRAFADGPFGPTLVTGERSPRGTHLRLIDLGRGCVSRTIELPSLVYGSLMMPDGTLVVSLVHSGTRAELGVWQIGTDPEMDPQQIISPPTGEVATAALREVALGLSSFSVQARWCAGGTCQTRRHLRRGTGLAALVDLDPDANTDNTSSLPFRSPRPVPVYDRWFPWSVLSYKYHATDTSPSWMRAAVDDAADDATDSSKSLSPIFIRMEGNSKGIIRYTSSFPSSCQAAIACASHDNDQWTLRMRPQGYDFRWGELRWCQKATSDGCFDAERVALHEFGHVVGLDHPETAGFRLSPSYTVMHQVTPSRPHSSWDRHGFGSCDVASLQEQYGLPTMSTHIAGCNDVDTRISLSTSASRLTAGSKLVLTATLRIRSDSAKYREISGIRLNARSVQLKRRPAGSSGAWTTSWMRWAEVPGIYTLTLYPRATYEYKAVFPSPDDEGLNGDTSDEVRVPVTGVCSGICPSEEDPT